MKYDGKSCKRHHRVAIITSHLGAHIYLLDISICYQSVIKQLQSKTMSFHDFDSSSMNSYYSNLDSEFEIIRFPDKNDVLFGRGGEWSSITYFQFADIWTHYLTFIHCIIMIHDEGAINQHVGNIKFREIVDQQKEVSMWLSESTYRCFIDVKSLLIFFLVHQTMT